MAGEQQDGPDDRGRDVSYRAEACGEGDCSWAPHAAPNPKSTIRSVEFDRTAFTIGEHACNRGYVWKRQGNIAAKSIDVRSPHLVHDAAAKNTALAIEPGNSSRNCLFNLVILVVAADLALQLGLFQRNRKFRWRCDEREAHQVFAPFP